MPQPFRPFIEDGAAITGGLEGCLCLFPLLAWSKTEQQLVNLSLIDLEAPKSMRLGLHKTQMDNASRITIPPPLRKFAGIEGCGEVVVAGAPTRLELWSEGRRWENINQVRSNPPAPEALRGLVG